MSKFIVGLGTSCLILAGCSTAPVKEYIDRPVEVRIEVAKPCIRIEQVPAAPTIRLDTTALSGDFPITAVVVAARLDNVISKQYIVDTQELLKACSK
jgi:hypothetical protein